MLSALLLKLRLMRRAARHKALTVICPVQAGGHEEVAEILTFAGVGSG